MKSGNGNVLQIKVIESGGNGGNNANLVKITNKGSGKEVSHGEKNGGHAKKGVVRIIFLLYNSQQ